MPSITRDEADRIAAKWVADSTPPGRTLTAAVHEFDLGYVVWPRQLTTEPPIVGSGRGIIDRETGELSVWPSLPVAMVIEQFRAQRAHRPPSPHAWDPTEQARRDLRRIATPANVTHLMLDGETVIARSIKGDAQPNHHRLVREFYENELAPEFRERGYDRCSDAAALSDALYLAESRRGAPLALAQARSELFAGAGMTTYRVREAGDPVAGTTGPPCISCALLGRHFGFVLQPPDRIDE